VIAGDTGPLHLAAALERPVVALFGPTDPARNGPFGTKARVLRHGTERRDHRRLAEPEAGLLEITVDEVVAASLELLGGVGPDEVR
jgi:heptosyltransferase-1